MSAPRDWVQEKVRQWAGFADEDLKVAQLILSAPDQCSFRLAAYHAQQCAEKYLKACLVCRGVDFPYTHNISILLELCSEHRLPIAGISESDALSRYAISTRYPGEDKVVSQQEATIAIELAVAVREVARAFLSSHGIQGMPTSIEGRK